MTNFLFWVKIQGNVIVENAADVIEAKARMVAFTNKLVADGITDSGPTRFNAIYEPIDYGLEAVDPKLTDFGDLELDE